MDAISLIVSALVAGAVAATQDVAGQTIKDAYGGFKALIQRKFGPQTDLIDAVTKIEAKPESASRQGLLKEELQNVKADRDAEIVAEARKLLDRLAQHGQIGGISYNATNSGSGAIAQGPGALAAGAGGVTVGGSVSGSTIVTGSNNQIDKSSAVFDQRGQKVQGNQTNVAGNANSRD